MWLIGMLILVACAGAVYAILSGKKAEEKRVAELIHRMEQEGGTGESLGQEELEPQRQGPVGRLVRRLQGLMPAAMLASYREKLLWAGKPYQLDAGQFVTLKLIGAAGLPMLVPVVSLFQLGATTLTLMVLAGVIGFNLPDLWLNARLAERRRMVAEELPLFADLVATAVSAGLPLTEAVRRVAADAPGLVAREFLRAVQEMAAGKPRMQAWRDLIDRVPGDDLRTVVNAIMQAEQYGTSVSELLRYQVQQIRLVKQQEAQRIAQATTVKMRIPMLLFILVPFMVLLLGPALMQIGQMLL